MTNRIVVGMLGAGLLLILSGVLTLAVTSGQTAAAQVKMAVPVVETSPGTVFQLGEPVAHAKKVNIAFGTGGTLAELLVAQGDVVDRGQLLAKLDARMAFAQLDKAKATLAKAQAEAAKAQFPLMSGNATPEVVSAQASLDAAQRNRDIIESGWNQRIAEAEARRDESAAEYERIFQKYLGLELATDELRLMPEELLSKAGIDLGILFDDALRPTAYGDLVFSTPGIGIPLAPVDDQATPWNEALVYGWLNYYEGEILTNFDALQVPADGISIAVEMMDAWAPLDESWAAYDAVELDKARDITGAENQMAIANQELQSVRGTITEPDAKSLEVALAEVAAAEADVVLAELLVANMEIRAPFAGTVAPFSSDVMPGGWVTAGTSIIVLQEASK